MPRQQFDLEDDHDMILVTGATGLTGSAVICVSAERGLPVRALIGDPAKLPALGTPQKEAT
jgi:uncharacterized protein YbjT (DUF2867 family)